MFERFSDRARRVVVRAQEEARMLSHNYIGTEHILLGLLAERDGVAARALSSLNVTIEAARDQVRSIVGEGSQELTGHIPFTPRAKKVLELSLREALNLRSDFIGTEHLLLGLVAEAEGVGAQILERLGAGAETVREKVTELARAEPEAAGTSREQAEPTITGWPPRATRIRVEAFGEVRDLLRSMDQRLSAIERHLGIATGADEPAAGAPTAGADEPAAESPPPGEAPPAAAE